MFVETLKHKKLTCNVDGKVVKIEFEDGLAEVSEAVGNFLLDVKAVELSSYQGEIDPEEEAKALAKAEAEAKALAKAEAKALAKAKAEAEKAAVNNDSEAK